MNASSTLLAATSNSGGSIGSLLVLILPLGALMYLMIVPQRKQRQKHQQFVSGLKVGDEVVTAGGMYGTITFLEDGVAHLEVDTDTVIRVAISSLTRSASEPAPAARTGGGRTTSDAQSAADDADGESEGEPS